MEFVGRSATRMPDFLALFLPAAAAVVLFPGPRHRPSDATVGEVVTKATAGASAMLKHVKPARFLLCLPPGNLLLFCNIDSHVVLPLLPIRLDGGLCLRKGSVRIGLDHLQLGDRLHPSEFELLLSNRKSYLQLLQFLAVLADLR